MFHDIESEVLGHKHLTGTVATENTHIIVAFSFGRVSVGVQSTPIPLRALPILLILFPGRHYLVGSGVHDVGENASTGRRVPCACEPGAAPARLSRPGALGGSVCACAIFAHIDVQQPERFRGSASNMKSIDNYVANKLQYR